ncbi:EYxxD motif small membrane protein [Bacillus carboniphilus]
MFLEYITDVTFVLACVIGSIIAFLFVFIKKRKSNS